MAKIMYISTFGSDLSCFPFCIALNFYQNIIPGFLYSDAIRSTLFSKHNISAFTSHKFSTSLC